MTRFVKQPNSMPFTCEEKCFVKIDGTVCVAPNSPDLNPVDYAVYKGQTGRC